jgi:hypothetical protein
MADSRVVKELPGTSLITVHFEAAADRVITALTF